MFGGLIHVADILKESSVIYRTATDLAARFYIKHSKI